MDRIVTHFRYERKGKTHMRVVGWVEVDGAVVEKDRNVFRVNGRWITSRADNPDEGGVAHGGLSDAVYSVKSDIASDLRREVIGAGEQAIAIAELDAFMETHEPEATREGLRARLRELSRRVEALEDKSKQIPLGAEVSNE